MKKYAFLLGAVTLISVAKAEEKLITHEVTQNKLLFAVEKLSVKTGESVNFKNNDRTPHNIMIRNNGMMENSGLQKPGENVVIEFANAGVYDVMCGIHPKMKMKVEVE